MCSHPIKYCRTPSEVHKKDTVWCKTNSVGERNCTWHVGSIPSKKTNVKEAKTSYTYELLCSFIVDPPQQSTIILKADNGTSNKYCCTEDMLVITNLKDTPDGPTFQLPNNATINAKKTGSIPLSGSLSTHAKKSHVFDGLHSASLISLGQLCYDDCISILDKNEINILKKRHLF